MLLDYSQTPGRASSWPPWFSSLTKRLFSFPAMLGTALVLLAVMTVRDRFNDPDLWWHLKTGEIIWNTHVIPSTDLFSFTTNNHPWVAHEWLAQVLIYGAWKFGGYTGLMVWLCVFAGALLVAQYALSSSYSGNAKVALLGGVTAWLFATIGLAIRPHMIGYLLLTIELLVVHLARSRDSRWFFALPPLFAIWVNCHGSFIFGLIVLAVFLFASFFDFRLGLLVSSRWERSKQKALALAFVLSVAALFLNPIGVEQVLYPIKTPLTQKIGLANVSEWQPLQFSDPRAFAMVGIAGGILLLALVRRSDLHFEELLLLGIGFVMASRHTRMLFVFGILATPVVCRLLADTWERYDAQRDRPAVNAGVMALLMLGITLGFPDRQNLTVQVEKGNPVKAVEFMRRTGLSGRMLNEYVYGGYLIWAAPETPVFVDGRGDVFDWSGVLEEFMQWSKIESDPTELLEKYRIDFCLLSRQSPMSRMMALLPGWRTVYSDETAIIISKK